MTDSRRVQAARTVLAAACLAITLYQAVGSSLELQLAGRRSLSGVACSGNDQCEAAQFCLHPALSSGAGSCSSCWRCCLFPEVYGACPDSCNCVEGALCEARDGCSPGMFCSKADPWNMPNCQRCDTCTSDAFELAGSCSVPCPSSDMSGLAALPNLTPRQYVFLSFLANEVSQQGAYVPTLLLPEELAAWVEGQGLSGEQANMTVFRMLGDGGFVTAQDWMAAVSESSSLALLCPAYDPTTSWENQTALVVSEGCYCNATVSAESFRCPAGQRCSTGAFRGLETDALRAPAAQIFRAVCVPCEAGQYCEEGTHVADESDLSSLDCPSGFYCPSPREMRECPAGSFCAERSTATITCNYEKLLTTDPYKELPLEPETVVTRLRDKRDPLRGNYCPAQSTRPYEVCSAGHYCPNVTTQLICPKGYFCKAQSTAPWKCATLTRCPEGTTVPNLSYMALVIAGVVLLGMPLIFLAFTYLDKSVMADADEENERDKDLHRTAAANRLTFRLLESIKLTHSPLEDKYRGFGKVSPRITMEFEGLGLQIKPRGGQSEVKHVLTGVSGSFVPQRLNAILGPSGCGKTTFLNVLCGKVAAGVGQVRINGDVMPVTRLKKIMGFVPQDDIVHEDLTVRENLNYSARMRLPADMLAERRRDVVRDALEMLGLTPIQNYRVGTVEKRGISGGQRKRVNIGLELVASPSLLFLDEPTSGLDATSSADILGSLMDMANLGMNIIMVIHQPRFNSFCTCNQVLLLGTGGRTVYLGSPYAAVKFFQGHLGFKFPDHENPADILMDIIAGKVPCVKDPKLRNCNQLVEVWNDIGTAWVELTEQRNPTMIHRLRDVDPAILEAWSEEFDIVDEDAGGTGVLSASQLVDLFTNMGQRLSLDDAILLIRKTNGKRPATARTGGAKSNATSVTSGGLESTLDDVEGLAISKEQLLDALQGARDEQGEATGTHRNAAANFYASQFELPDLPEVQAYRKEMERKRKDEGGPPRRHDSSSSGSQKGEQYGGAPAQYDGVTYSNDAYGSVRYMGGETMLLPTASAGGSVGGEHVVDSDSYSPVYHGSPTTMRTAAASGGGALPRIAVGVPGEGATTPGGGATPVAESATKRAFRSSPKGEEGYGTAAGNLTVRARALPPGLTATGSASSGALTGAAAAAAGSDGGSDGLGCNAVAASDLSGFAARRRLKERRSRTKKLSSSRGSRRRSEIRPAGEDSSDEAGHGSRSRWPATDNHNGNGNRLGVAPGLMANSLAAMEALTRSDVPLPALPRRLDPTVEVLGTVGGRAAAAASRSDRRSSTYTALAAYVGAYNEATADDVGGGGGSAATGRDNSGRMSSLASRAVAAARRASAKVSAVNGEGDVWGSAAAQQQQLLFGGAPAADGAQRASVAAPAQLQEEEGSGEDVNDSAVALPPLLQQLAAAALPSRGGPVAEGVEDGDGGGAVERSPFTTAAGGVASPQLAAPPPAWLQQRLQAGGGGGSPSRSPLATVASLPTAESPQFSTENRADEGGDFGSPSRKPRDGGAHADGGLSTSAMSYSSGLPAGGGSLATHVSSPHPVTRGTVSYNGGVTNGTVRTTRLAVMTTAAMAPPVDGQVTVAEVAAPSLQNDVSAGSATTVHIGEGETTNLTDENDSDRSAPGNSIPHLGGGGGGAGGGIIGGSVVIARSTGGGSVGGGSVGGGSTGGSLSRFADNRPPDSADRSPHAPTHPRSPLAHAHTGGSMTVASSSLEPRVGKQRRASVGALGPGGGVRKQRRGSWMQQPASFSSQGTGADGGSGTPGGGRKAKKDTMYVNSLLSNALVGAWAATQSVTAGRMNQSVARMLRPHLGADYAPDGSVGGGTNGSHSGTPHRHGTGHGPGVLGPGPRVGSALNVHRSQASAYETPSKAHSYSGGLALTGALGARLAMEDALASRKAQGFFAQLMVLLRRGCVKYVRSFWPMRVVDTILQLAAAFIIGLVHGTKWGLTSVPSNTVMCMVCLGVLSTVTHLRTFSNNRVLLWRESASGMSILAYYLSQNIIDQLWVFTAPALALGVYWYLTLPRMPFSEFYVVGLFVCWWASGMAYLVSAILPPQNVLMAGVFISLIFGAFLHGLSPAIAAARGTLLEGVLGLSYNRWAMEIVTINEMKYYQDDMRNVIIMMSRGIGLCGVDTLLEDDGNGGISPSEAISFLRIQYNFNMDYCTQYKSTAYGALVVLGLGFRIVAFLFLRFNTGKRH